MAMSGLSNLLLFAVVASLWPALTHALPKNRTDDQVEAAIDAGTFQNPSVNVRPYFRYWLPDASINTTHLDSDILALAARGAGGIEFLNYYNYGGTIAPPPTDWVIYGYATPAYRRVLKSALEAHKEHGLKMDYAMGPQSGQGVPAAPDAEGLEFNLYSYNVTLPADLTYEGQIPGWGLGDLMSVTTFAIVGNTTLQYEVPGLLGAITGAGNYTQLTISSESLVEWTSHISSDGHVNLTAMPVQGASSHLLYASYARRSYDRADVNHTATPQNIIQNGSFAVDHFSVEGAKLTTNFLETHILVDGIKELMIEAGNYIWEDSVEIPGTTYWTPKLLSEFHQRYGYSLTKYTVLLAGNAGYQSATYGTTIISDAPDHGSGIVDDYRELLTTLYASYLKYLTAWGNDYLDLQFSAQIGYNLPVDMLANIPYVNAPECETLSFTNYIDGFRQYTGPANLAGKRVISIELGADPFATYTQSLFQLLDEAKHAFVAGVNRVVIHGADYSYNYVNTTWPGFTSFGYVFAAQHSRHQPGWDVGYPQALNWLARTQYVLQSGIPKTDLVFWDKQTAQAAYPLSLYAPGDLVAAGYTYQYLSPDNFVLDTAYVQNATLAPTRQAFKALVIRANDTMTAAGASGLAKFAKAGLPIIVSGGFPTTYNTRNAHEISTAQKELRGISSLPNVHHIPLENLAATVATLGIAPRTKVSSNGTWITRWHDTSNGDSYVFVYHDGSATPAQSSAGTIAFASTKTPYQLNAWTGAITPVVEYSVQNARTIIPFTLQNSETAIIMFTDNCQDLPPPPKHQVISAPASVIGYISSSSGGLKAKVKEMESSKQQSVMLSNGAAVSLSSASAPAAFALTNWNLTVEKWLSPSDPFNLDPQANKTNTTFNLAGTVLPSWPSIDGLSNTSGVGYYSASFSWTPQSNVGAILTIPPGFQGIVGRVNGKELPTLDLTNPTADVSEFLVAGQNTVEIISSTTLFNGLRPIYDTLETGGSGPITPLEALVQLGLGSEQPEGVVGVVVITPYKLVSL